MSQYTATDGIVEAFCALLRPFVHPKAHKAGAQCRIPGTERKDGIMVMFNQSDVGLIMFRFITKDYLEIQLPFEMDRLAKEGKDYMHGRIELLQSQLEPARQERAADHAIDVYTGSQENELSGVPFVDHKNRKQGVVH